LKNTLKDLCLKIDELKFTHRIEIDTARLGTAVENEMQSPIMNTDQTDFGDVINSSNINMKQALKLSAKKQVSKFTPSAKK